jgi:hypothetical protein
VSPGQSSQPKDSNARARACARRISRRRSPGPQEHGQGLQADGGDSGERTPPRQAVEAQE